MSGWFGLGKGKEEKQDRSSQLQAQGNLNSVFNYGLPTGQAQESAGQKTTGTALGDLGKVKDHWTKLLSAGRTDASQLAAPAVNAQLDSADATRRQEANFGTSRGGGTNSFNREAGATSTKNIDDIINKTLFGAHEAGAQGLEKVAGAEAGIGGLQLQNALNILGLGTGAEEDVLGSTLQSRNISFEQRKQTGQDAGTLIGMALLGLGG